MNKEFVSLSTTNLMSHVRREGTVMYQTMVSLEVDGHDVGITQMNDFITLIIETSKNGNIVCSKTSEPFIIRDSQTANIAHGIEHIAVARMLTQFRTGKGHTDEWARQDVHHKAISSITLYAFEPKGHLFRANERTLRQDIIRAIGETNAFFSSSLNPGYR
jgi:hypothetical protein